MRRSLAEALQPARQEPKRMKVAIKAIAAGIVVAASLCAQPGEEDVGEASASTGLAVGGTGTNVAVTGAIGTSLDRYLILMIEGAYIPMGSKTFITYPGVVAHSSGLYDFSGSLQFRAPLKSRWEPYGIVGPVLIYNHYRRQTVHAGGTISSFGASDVRGGAVVGGGVRYYWRENWGFKGEYRYTVTSRNFSLLLVGVFRQF